MITINKKLVNTIVLGGFGAWFLLAGTAQAAPITAGAGTYSTSSSGDELTIIFDEPTTGDVDGNADGLRFDLGGGNGGNRQRHGDQVMRDQRPRATIKAHAAKKRIRLRAIRRS